MIALAENSTRLASPSGDPYDRIIAWESELSYGSQPRLLEANAIGEPATWEGSGAVLLGEESNRRRYISPYVLLKLGFGSANVFDEEGDRVYLDHNDHPEVSTAEEISIQMLVKRILRGRVKMAQGMARGAAILAEQYGVHAGAVLLSNISDPRGNAWGNHENFLIRRALGFHYLEDALITNYATRPCWTGAGAVRPNEDNPDSFRYVLSERADHIEELMSLQTTTKRPFINTRDEPHADEEHFRRLHGIHGEPLHNPRIMELRCAAMLIILRACELGISFDRFRLDDPRQAIRQVSNDPTLRTEIRLKNGKNRTGPQIQYDLLEYCAKAAREAHYLTEQEESYVDPLLNLLERVMRDPRDLPEDIGSLDWTIKQELIDKRLAKGRTPDQTDWDIAWAVVGAYHSIYPNEGGGLRLLRKQKFPGSPTASELDEALPLPDTRAKLRAGAKRRARERQLEDVIFDWGKVERGDIGHTITAPMPDPYAMQSDEVDRLLAAA